MIKDNDYISGILKCIMGVACIIGTILYMLACVFAPFGVVWLVLNN